MPNHVKHRMEVKIDADCVFAALKSKDSAIDFNNVVPMPELLVLLKGVDGITSYVTDAAELAMIYSGWPVYDYRGRKKTEGNFMNYGHQRQWVDDDFSMFERCCKAIMQHGYSNWHPWSVVNWGTKWNAYAVKKEGDVLEFETAWNTPMKIWEKLAEILVNASIHIKYASEDYGSHCGIITIINGTLTHKQMETAEFAYKVWRLSDEVIKEMESED